MNYSRKSSHMQQQIARIPSRRRQAGVGLIEVLVAVLIMGIGLLGIAAMQATALRNSQSSLESSQAVIQTYAILEAMRANRTEALANAYVIVKTCAKPTASGSLANNDLANWIESLQTTLGAGSCGTIACNDGDCTVTVTWDDSRAVDVGEDGETAVGATARDVVVHTSI